MKKLLISTTALVVLAGAASAQDKVLNVLDWGGAYGESHKVAYNAPFEEKTGIKITVTDADNPATPIKAMVEAGNVTADVASVEYADAVRLCDEGALEQIDPAILAAGPGGEAAGDHRQHADQAPLFGQHGKHEIGVRLGQVEEFLHAVAQADAVARTAALLVAQLHAELAGESLDGLGEGQVIELLHEGDDVATLAAAEAVVGTDRLAHGEARRLLVVEGAQPLHRADARRAQGDVLTDDIGDRGALLDRLHVLRADPSRHCSPHTLDPGAVAELRHHFQAQAVAAGVFEPFVQAGGQGAGGERGGERRAGAGVLRDCGAPGAFQASHPIRTG